jgi:hypothetical protein
MPSASKSEIDSEIKALERILNADTQSLFKPVLDDIKPDKGFEKALSRALGDTLMASKDKDAPSRVARLRGGNNIETFPPCPRRHAQAGAAYVQAPAYLQRALDFIGVVDTQLSRGMVIAAALETGPVHRVASMARTGAGTVCTSRRAASDRHAIADAAEKPSGRY